MARRTAILIGQAHFPADEELLDLSYPHRDIEAVAAVLQANDGIPYDDVHLIHDGPHHAALAEVETVADGQDRGDLILIYYSGHGLVDRRERLHLAFENTQSRFLTGTALKISLLLDVVDGCSARSRLLALDCCYAGAIGSEFNRSNVEGQIQAEVGGFGTFIMTASTATQVAKESPDYGHGVFTRHFLDGLAGAADENGDGRVTAQELFAHVHRRTADEACQRPRKFNMDGEGNIVLRETGREPRREKAEAIRVRLYDLARDHQISDAVLVEGLRVVASEPHALTPNDCARFDLMAEHLDGEFRPGPFHAAWGVLGQGSSEEPVAAPVLTTTVAGVGPEHRGLWELDPAVRDRARSEMQEKVSEMMRANRDRIHALKADAVRSARYYHPMGPSPHWRTDPVA